MDAAITDAVAGSTIAAGAGWPIVAIVVLAIIRGWLVPAPQVERLIADRDAQIRDWRETARSAEKRSDLLAQNQDKLLQGLDTANALIRSVADAARDAQGDRR